MLHCVHHQNLSLVEKWQDHLHYVWLSDAARRTVPFIFSFLNLKAPRKSDSENRNNSSNTKAKVFNLLKRMISTPKHTLTLRVTHVITFLSFCFREKILHSLLAPDSEHECRQSLKIIMIFKYNNITDRESESFLWESMDYKSARSSTIKDENKVKKVNINISIFILVEIVSSHEWHLNFSPKLHQWRLSNALEAIAEGHLIYIYIGTRL